MNVENIRNITVVILALMAFAGVAGGLMLVFAVHRMRSLNIPADATFTETLHLTPLTIVLAIDLLDLGLDVLAAPLSWVILDRLGLKALRGVATVEALLPGTQFIPTMTLCWFGVRLLDTRFGNATVRQLTAR
jgi:hypothetical protein